MVGLIIGQERDKRVGHLSQISDKLSFRRDLQPIVITRILFPSIPTT